MSIEDPLGSGTVIWVPIEGSILPRVPVTISVGTQQKRLQWIFNSVDNAQIRYLLHSKACDVSNAT
jgi:hypothetical protein